MYVDGELADGHLLPKQDDVLAEEHLDDGPAFTRLAPDTTVNITGSPQRFGAFR